MPGFDGTGPAGMGPMTGGARGWCNPYGAPYGPYTPYRYPYRAPLLGRPRWGMGRGFWGRGAVGRGFWGRGAFGRGFRGRGRGRW
jgi:hypothetical protein